MKTLILSCNTGEGHNSCAKAICEYYTAAGEDCRIVDALAFISPGVSRIISGGHNFLYRRLPGLFDWGYTMAARHPALFRRGSMLFRFFARGIGALRQWIVREEITDVICTHPFAALMLTALQKQDPMPLLTAFLATDYTCSPGVRESGLDLYFIPDARLIPEFECPHIPAEKIVISGIPVRQCFFGSRRAERRGEDLVMMCGSMGCGPMEELTGLLLRQLPPENGITVICGRNRKLKRRLSRKFANDQKIRILGYAEEMEKLLEKAKVYLTKAGGISVSEAAVAGVPMVLIDAIGGCERYNRLFFEVRNGVPSGKTAKELAELCGSLLKDEAKRCRMETSFMDQPYPNGAAVIYKTMRERSGR